MSSAPKARFFTKDGTEFNLWDEEAGEYVSELQYNHHGEVGRQGGGREMLPRVDLDDRGCA